MRVEIFGTGCAKCKRLKKNVEKAVMNISHSVEIVEVSDLQEIIDRGVMMTPALFVDGEAKAIGRVPSVGEIEIMLTN